MKKDKTSRPALQYASLEKNLFDHEPSHPDFVGNDVSDILASNEDDLEDIGDQVNSNSPVSKFVQDNTKKPQTSHPRLPEGSNH